MCSELKAFQERFTVGAVLAAKREKTPAEKLQLLFHRGVLTWDEVAEEFTARGLGDPVPYIGTREQYFQALRDAGLARDLLTEAGITPAF